MKSEIRQYVNISNKMARDILDTDKNTVFSPYSFIYLLGMVYEGLSEEEKLNWNNTFGTESLYDPQMKQFLKKFSSSSMAFANGLFIDPKAKEKVYEEYEHELKDNFDADIVDSNNINLINKWVEEKTNGMIKELKCRPDVINLLNASVFKEDWAMPYDDVDRDYFKTFDGRKKRCWMMHSDEWDYVSDSVFEGFLKYYRDERYCFMAFLPKEDDLSGLKGISIQTIIDLYKSRSTEKLKVMIPKFEFDCDIDLKNILSSLGINKIFSPGNSITNMADITELYIGEMKQQSHIKLDENGTVAAAVSAAIACAGCLPSESIKYLDFNRPFIFAIMDTEYQLPIFVGRINTVK